MDKACMDKAWDWYTSGQLKFNAAKLNEAEFRLLLALRRHKDGDAIARVLAEVLDRLKEGRAKHERFAENVFHALSFFEAEVGETAQEIVKQREGWERRAKDELIDSVVVAIRMLLKEYIHEETQHE